MMAVYTTIPDADINPDKPIKSATAYALRDNLIAALEGASGAPSVTSRIITPGGSRADGALVDATSLSGPGFFDYSSMAITAPKSLPFVSFLRIDGNATLSSTLTARRVFASSASEIGTLAALGGTMPGVGTVPGGNDTGGGGGVVGDAGSGALGADFGPGLVPSPSVISRLWAARRALVGGNSQSPPLGLGVAGGGCLYLIVNGDLNATGGTIDASGLDGALSGGQSSGGGGGGAIVVICTGVITAGTYDASGGDGNGGGGGGSRGGGGGGGLVLLVATSFAGTRTGIVTGGAGPGVADDGAAGYFAELTLTAGQINAFLIGAGS